MPTAMPGSGALPSGLTDTPLPGFPPDDGPDYGVEDVLGVGDG